MALLNFFKRKTEVKPRLICWFEIPVFDFKRGLFFYTHVFRHLEFNITEFNGVAHAIFKPSNSSVDFSMSGALVQYEKKAGDNCGTVLLFDANSGMEEILDRVVKYGGTVLKGKSLIKNSMDDGTIIIPKTLIDGNVGYYAYFLDSEGNKMGLYSNA
jgi:predicted enzyme related to lactoylglutathione lyase